MKSKVSAIIIASILSTTANAWERVTSISELGDPNYIYEIVMAQPLAFQGEWSINMNDPYNGSNVYLFKSEADQDQLFRLNGKLIKRDKPNNFSDYCLNAYNPKNGSNVNAWECDTNDSDQYWSYTVVQNEYVMIEANNSGYCLNAYNPYYYTNVNLYKCDSSDHEQLFSIFREPSN